MRVVGGKHRGRRLAAPQGKTTRPTSDRARESLFNILAHGDFGDVLEGARVLDAFCGSGALGLEALSRGAAHVVLMDNDGSAMAAAQENAEALGEETHVTCLTRDATNPPRAEKPCGLVFLDPPYDGELGEKALTALSTQGWLAPGALCVMETAKDEEFTAPPGFDALKERAVGAACFHILRYEGGA
ncbi:MAG: 16S rRNA (guanine(966)-N(2))-methyltransferase RsmD [Alphaproteobacteria bacterium]|nr:16S rRNA (guanine(966)-N(2))-methyltransferase RsmD [Alphaproteobacteria bacterium]